MKIVVMAVTIASLFLAIYVAADHRSSELVAAASNSMLQSMERGYQCHAAGRRLDDCQQEQRARWANPADLPPFGSKR